jgi:lipoic acid synthetase
MALYGIPARPEWEELQKVAQAVQRMGLLYVVITSVTRYDLTAGGDSLFADTIRTIYSPDQRIKIWILIPDFKGEIAPPAEVLRVQPTVLGHNVETVPRLYPKIRGQALPPHGELPRNGSAVIV